MLANWFLGIAYSWANTRGRIPEYTIQSDGKVEVNFIKRKKTDERANDLELDSKQQIKLEGYSNNIQFGFDSKESQDESTRNLNIYLKGDNGKNEKVSLHMHPSDRYKSFMKMDVMRNTFMPLGTDMETVKYLSIGTAIMIFMVIVILLS